MSVRHQQHLGFNNLLQDLDPGVPGQTQALWLKHSYLILDTIIRAAPGISVSCYHMAYVKFLQGKCESHGKVGMEEGRKGRKGRME